MGATAPLASAFSFPKFTTGQKYLRIPPKRKDLIVTKEYFQSLPLYWNFLSSRAKKAPRTVELLFVPVCLIFFFGKTEVVSNAVTHQSPCHFLIAQAEVGS